MKNFIGIDLGTTNSAIASFNGTDIRIWKSPEQNDVTPSVIYIDNRSKHIGARAYDLAAMNPSNAATLFKRAMGTNTPFHFVARDHTWSPEECSAEILKILFGYLPEEIRNNPDIGTVITVPAAFNQMQKDATMQAADMAGIGKVALMQEPVAAVMSVMRARPADSMFLVYDLGGGTLDIAIAESIGGRVNLLAHGGIAVCGGRDFDRAIFNQIVKPWLQEHFELPDDFSANQNYQLLRRMAEWAVERAKIELSAREESVISLAETEVRTKDVKGNDIYLDIPLKREVYDQLIASQLADSIEAARETLSKAGLSPQDLDRIVFVGGPTNYKPLRDKVSFELGIPGSTDVNPMTAVAEGASVFAESIDWTSRSHSRKSARGQISTGGDLALGFNYIARTPDSRAKIAVQLSDEAAPGSEFQIDSTDTGWNSGRLALKQGETFDLPLAKSGENTFKIFAFSPDGFPIKLQSDTIVITKTAATIDAIPASHSIFIEVLEKLGGRPTIDYLVRAGDALPLKGKKPFKSAESLKAGDFKSLNFKLWEGDIETPITDNRPIGVLKISGSDFDDGIIPAGAVLECEYEVLDSGNIILEISVPSIGGTFRSGKNFYSRQEGQLDYASASELIVDEGKVTLQRVESISESVDSPKLKQARERLESVVALESQKADAEQNQEAMEKVLAARKILDQVRKEHLKEIRKIDLDVAVSFFNDHLRQYAKESEATSFDSLAQTSQRSIDRNDKDFEHHLDELNGKIFGVLWRQDWFVVERFKRLLETSHLFMDKQRFVELTNSGMQHLRAEDIERLRPIVAELSMMQVGGSQGLDMAEVVNILKG